MHEHPTGPARAHRPRAQRSGRAPRAQAVRPAPAAAPLPRARACHLRAQRPTLCLHAQRPCPAPAPLVIIQFCIAIQFGLLQPFQPRYSELYCDTLLPLNQLSQFAIQYLYCNTIFFPTKYLAIQFFPATYSFSAIQYSALQ